MRRAAQASHADVAERISALAHEIGAQLAARRLMLTAAESCTAGGLAYAVTQVAGSSAWFDRGFVTYSNQAKQQMLGVSGDLLARFGAVSEPVAEAMATGALTASAAKVAIAITGVAGPGGGSPHKPVGTVCFSWAVPDARGQTSLRTTTRHLSGDRAAVRTRAIIVALEGLLPLLERGADV